MYGILVSSNMGIVQVDRVKPVYKIVPVDKKNYGIKRPDGSINECVGDYESTEIFLKRLISMGYCRGEDEAFNR